VTLSLALTAYLRLVQKSMPVVTVLNISGPTFFLPFVVVQPVDQMIIAVWGWALVPVSIIHTAVLLWESWATLEIISSLKALQASQKVVGIVVLAAVWMLVTGPVWR
jgi:hypothetical protein